MSASVCDSVYVVSVLLPGQSGSINIAATTSIAAAIACSQCKKLVGISIGDCGLGKVSLEM